MIGKLRQIKENQELFIDITCKIDKIILIIIKYVV